jgi:hypothetical protein
MVVELKEFTSAVDISKSIETQIAETKSALGEYLRRLDDIRALAERSKKIREIVYKLAGKKTLTDTPGELTIGGLNLVLDANPFHELTAIEEVVRGQQEKLIELQKAREALKWVDQIGETEGVKYLVIENNGVPRKILLKIV